MNKITGLPRKGFYKEDKWYLLHRPRPKMITYVKIHGASQKEIRVTKAIPPFGGAGSKEMWNVDSIINSYQGNPYEYPRKSFTHKQTAMRYAKKLLNQWGK